MAPLAGNGGYAKTVPSRGASRWRPDGGGQDGGKFHRLTISVALIGYHMGHRHL